MVINGGSRAGTSSYTSYLGAHLQRTDSNERVLVREMDGVVSADLTDAFQEMAAIGLGSKSSKPLYHANIDWRHDEVLTEAQKVRAVDRLAEELGLTGQPRVVVEHVKEGREHLHVVWCRIDAETMRAIPDSHNFRKHEIVARELEREFGHERVQGAHHERDDVERPARCPTFGETMQAARSGMTPAEAKAQLRELWQSADGGQAFAAALEDAGWTLAQGDKRGFVALDPAGEAYAVNKAITGLSAAQVRERMADLDAGQLPGVDAARARQCNRRNEAAAVEREVEAAAMDARQAGEFRPYSPEFIAEIDARLAREAQERGDNAARDASHAMEDLARTDPLGTERQFGHHAGDRLKSPEEMRRDYADMMRGGVSAERAADNAAAWEDVLSPRPEQAPDPAPQRDPLADRTAWAEQLREMSRPDPASERQAWADLLRDNGVEPAPAPAREAARDRGRERVLKPEPAPHAPGNERRGVFERLGDFVRKLWQGPQPEPQPDRAADRQPDHGRADQKAEPLRAVKPEPVQDPVRQAAQEPVREAAAEQARPRPAERLRPDIADEWLAEACAEIKAERDAETPEQRQARESQDHSRNRGDGSRERTRHHHRDFGRRLEPFRPHHDTRWHSEENGCLRSLRSASADQAAMAAAALSSHHSTGMVEGGRDDRPAIPAPAAMPEEGLMSLRNQIDFLRRQLRAGYPVRERLRRLEAMHFSAAGSSG